jgi:hypothetical protein
MVRSSPNCPAGARMSLAIMQSCVLIIMFVMGTQGHSFVEKYSKSMDKQYPVPIPAGGRFDVHGWLILPFEQSVPTDPSTPIHAWFSHHVPEFWFNSPHNFQIILRGTITPTASVHEDIYPLNLPLPAASDLLKYEYSFTPPSPFSLNDLLSLNITKFNGVYYNGSFDTPYQRIPESLAEVRVHELTTATYINETETSAFSNLRYLSYPRGNSESNHFYLAHEIKVQPDFDHIVHVTMDNCAGRGLHERAQQLLHVPGSSWEFEGVENNLSAKLSAGQVLKARLMSLNQVDTVDVTDVICSVIVLESLHCMIGPGFMDNC